MVSNKYLLGELITQRREKNPGGDLPIRGVSKDGLQPPKQIDADTSIYNVYYRNDFVYNPARMELGSIAFNDEYDKAICSSLYEVFFVHRTDLVIPEYLALFIKNPEFARYCDFIGSGSAREYCRFDSISRIPIHLPSIEEQRKIVHNYSIISERIKILNSIIEKLESLGFALFDHVTESALHRGTTQLKDYLSFGNGKARPDTIGGFPVYGGNGILSYTDVYNAENVTIIGRVGAYCGSVHIEQKRCWISDNAIVAKSRVVEDEYFDYFLLKKSNLFSHHIGTGQQLLTQGILNSVTCAAYTKEDIESFNQNVNPIFSSLNCYNAEIEKLECVVSFLLSTVSSK